MRRGQWIAIVLFLVSSFSYAISTRDILDSWIEIAFHTNPDILATQAKSAATYQRIRSAQSLTDPLIAIGYQNEGFSDITLGKMPGTQWNLALSQMYPANGVLKLRGDIASGDYTEQSSELMILKSQIAGKISELFFDYIFLEKTRITLHKQQDWLLKINQSITAQYASQRADQRDLLQLQLQSYMLIEKEENISQSIQAKHAQIYGLLGYVPTTSIMDSYDENITSFNFTLDQVITLALQTSPWLRQRRIAWTQAQAQEALIQKSSLPDMTWTAGISPRGNTYEPMWNISAAWNWPLYADQKQQTLIYAASLSTQQSEYIYAGMELALRSALNENVSVIQSSKKLMALYRNALIPKSIQIMDSTLASYQQGTVSLSAVLNTLSDQQNYQLAYWQQWANYEKAISAVKVWSGENIK